MFTIENWVGLFGTWRAPAIGRADFAVTFSLSALVIGPKISGSPSDKTLSVPGPSAPSGGHDSYH